MSLCALGIILLFLDQASGISIIFAIGKDLPVRTNNSNAASNDAVSEFPDLIIGFKSSMFSIRSLSIPASCVFIQFTLPFKVLISPL